MIEKVGRGPGDPWECGRCASEGSRAVLTRDRTPGCHVCRDVTGAMGLLNLLLAHIWSAARMQPLFDVETPFKAMFDRPHQASRIYIVPVVT